jgi:hypothetical protein
LAGFDGLRKRERLLSKTEQYCYDAKSVKEQVDEAQVLYQDVKTSVSDVRTVAIDLHRESGVSEAAGNQLTDDQDQAGPKAEIHEDDISTVAA